MNKSKRLELQYHIHAVHELVIVQRSCPIRHIACALAESGHRFHDDNNDDSKLIVNSDLSYDLAGIRVYLVHNTYCCTFR